jgi:hypothetical protein
MIRIFSVGMIAATGLVISGCGQADLATSRSTVTVKLPPAQPATPRPGFSNASEPGFQP